VLGERRGADDLGTSDGHSVQRSGHRFEHDRTRIVDDQDGVPARHGWVVDPQHRRRVTSYRVPTRSVESAGSTGVGSTDHVDVQGVTPASRTVEIGTGNSTGEPAGIREGDGRPGHHPGPDDGGPRVDPDRRSATADHEVARRRPPDERRHGDGQIGDGVIGRHGHCHIDHVDGVADSRLDAERHLLHARRPHRSASSTDRT